jgi:hypothetical protein
VSKGGDLEDNQIYCDGCKVVKHGYRWTALVYDHHSRKLQEIFVAYIQSESYEAVSQVLASWHVTGLKGYQCLGKIESVAAHVVNPAEFMMDEAEGPGRAVDEQFMAFHGEGRGRRRSCAFHFGECRCRMEIAYLPEECREEHKMRCELLLGAATKEDMEVEAEELMDFYKEKCTTPKDALAMEGWLQYWIQR